MPKPMITPQHFVDLVNERLPNHPQFEPGIRVFLFPIGATSDTATGYGFEPRSAAGVVAETVAQVRAEYGDLGIPPVVTGHP